MNDNLGPSGNRLAWYRERIAYHVRELEDLDEEYRHKRGGIEQALAHLRAEVEREYPENV